MSFAGKNLTQGGQMTAYRWRMFIQVNNWIGFWIFILFAVLTTAIFLWRIPQEALDNGSLWWFASINSSFIDLMPASGTPKIYDVHYWYAPTATAMVLKMTLPQIYTDPYMQAMGDQCLRELQWAAGASGLFSMVVFIAVTWFIANIGRKESEDEYISGMQLTDKPAEVNKLLRKNGEFSDLRVGDLHMVRMAEVLNFLMHGTIGVGKSTLIRWLLDYIRKRGIRDLTAQLAPETQRKQAKAIWAMGQPVNKTAIGRAWVRHQGMQDASLTAKIIPATRRFPEPALALPVYDNNGRSAGLALVSLVASPEGRMTQGETRMVMTERARGAVLQRSQSGNTIVASDLTAALDAVRNNPKDGVVWQTGDEPPSAWLLKVSGGTKQDVSPGIVSTLTDEQSVQQLREQMLADLVRNEEASRSRQPESLLAEVPQEEVIRLKPEDINPRKPEPLNPDADVIARVRGEENTDGREIKAAAGVRSELEGADKASGEQSRASRVIADLANAERDMLRAAENTERGRTPEREEQTLTRTIQKER